MIDNNYKQNNINDIKKPRTEGQFTDVMIKDTVKFQEKYGFEIGPNGSAWNNESDAFRHAYMQAYLTLRYNNFVAKQLGNYHEWDGNKTNGQDNLEELMDQHNNNIGREIGSEIRKEQVSKNLNPDSPEIKEIIARKVVERMQKGDLILEPSGRRHLKKKLNIPQEKTSNKINGCAGSYSVSGYTRSDGTKVDGYTRTCGAKHLGMSLEERRADQEKYKGKRFQDIPLDELEKAIGYFI